MVVLIQVDTVHPMFLWEHDYAKQNGLYSLLPHNNLSVNSSDLPFPGEWNSDGNVFFAIGGSVPIQHDHRDYIFIYEIKPDGTVVSRLKNAIPPWYGVIKIERQQDKTLLLWAVRTDLSNYACFYGPLPARPFTWIKDKITSVAFSYWDAYGPNPYADAIGWEVYHLTTMAVSAQFDDHTFSQILLELLVHYDAIDQRNAGWQLAQDLVKEAKESHRLAEGTYVDKVFMPTMTQLYEAHRTFVHPDQANLPQYEVGLYDRDGG
jgi:hypothetical protein